MKSSTFERGLIYLSVSIRTVFVAKMFRDLSRSVHNSKVRKRLKLSFTLDTLSYVLKRFND